MPAEVETPLGQPTKKDVLFHWDKPQETAYEQLKNLCCEAPLLADYDVNKYVTIQRMQARVRWALFCYERGGESPMPQAS